MPRLQANEIPRLRLHKASGRAVTTLSGKDFYCGKWGAPEAQAEYRRLTAQWLAAGRKFAPEVAGMSVATLVGEWTSWAEGRFTKRGVHTSYVNLVRTVGRDLAALYGPEPAARLAPGWLRTLTGTWKSRGLAVRTCNKYMAVVRGLARWAVARELIPADAVVRLEAVGHVSDRDGFRESPGVRTVPEDVVRATLAAMGTPRHRTPRAILEFMRLTGARPQEACAVRLRDLDRSGPVWIYKVSPDWNKTHHLGNDRVIVVGGKAQEVLRPFIARAEAWGDQGYLFRGQAGGSYRPGSLATVIRRAARTAGVPPWGANRLRHNFATQVRARYGLEAARLLLGHTNTSQTLVYAEPDRDLARRVAEDLG